ncbi:stage II sporulation protein P [Jeotgalibacillus marinus]|uniref:Stage II sporulation protein P n=1 Tax=Jeotgalibacillus marinus TaxID=86667 RepID=A0ABV3PZG3_9BACL
MKRTKITLIEPVLSQTVYSILRTIFLLLSLVLTAVCMPSFMMWAKDNSIMWPQEIPDWWAKAFVQMETSSIMEGETPVIKELLAQLQVHASDPSKWLTMEGVFFNDSSAFAQSSEATGFPEHSESTPPSLNDEADAIQPILQESTASTADHPNKLFLYFTHPTESFLPYLETENSDLANHSKVNISDMGPFLQTAFQNNGIGVVLDDTDIAARLKEQGLAYADSYDESRKVVQEAMGSIPELTYFVDLHRDSLRREETTLEHNEKVYAKMSFVVGGGNDQKDENLALANEVHEKLNDLVPGISRDVIIKEGSATDGKFNQDLSTKSLLLELGGVDNTFDELERSSELFAEVLSEIILEEEAEAVNQP